MKTRLRMLLLPLALAASLLVLGGCASAPDVRVNFDQTIDFKQYQTFGFVSPLGTDRDGYQSLVSQYLTTATTREMQARGLRLVTSDPQLLVNFNASLSDKLLVMSTPVVIGPYGGGRGYYGYRAGMYSAYPRYMDQTTVTQYQEGTLNVDIVDAQRKQLVWEGVVRDSVTQKELSNLQPAIEAATAAAFAKFPVPVKKP